MSKKLMKALPEIIFARHQPLNFFFSIVGLIFFVGWLGSRWDSWFVGGWMWLVGWF